MLRTPPVSGLQTSDDFREVDPKLQPLHSLALVELTLTSPQALTASHTNARVPHPTLRHTCPGIFEEKAQELDAEHASPRMANRQRTAGQAEHLYCR